MQNRSGIRFGLSSVVDEAIENFRLKTERLQGRTSSARILIFRKSQSYFPDQLIACPNKLSVRKQVHVAV